jgi:hypothetical protein
MLKQYMNIIGRTQIIKLVRSILLEETEMNWIRNLVNKIKLEIRYRRKLKELRKRDPFIYK